MIGFTLARGKYIVHIDSDGQDNPADLKKFIDKLDEGTDLVVGFKQKRKDGKIYMISSKIGNGFTRMLTGVKVHDMNCGFKGYKHHVAKGLNIKGRWYRYIPAIVSARGYKIEEVPIENRKREWGSTNFNFRNRLEGGLFDMPAVIAVTKMGDTPLYFWGWIALVLGMISIVSIIASFFLLGTAAGVYVLMIGGIFFMLLGIVVITALTMEYSRFKEFESIESYGIREVYPKK
jgi:glycosyltransferase involved in cell wall biosynthesis